MTAYSDEYVTPVEAHVCWALLRTTQVGRLAIGVADGPDIFPINFVVDRGTVIFRTGEGTKLAGSLSAPAVAFEADGYRPDAGEAWSVVIKGHAEEIIRADELMDTTTVPLFPWHATPKGHFVRIVPDAISGRRFRVVGNAAWGEVSRRSRQAE